MAARPKGECFRSRVPRSTWFPPCPGQRGRVGQLDETIAILIAWAGAWDMDNNTRGSIIVFLISIQYDSHQFRDCGNILVSDYADLVG
jgi:hypothetical protein